MPTPQLLAALSDPSMPALPDPVTALLRDLDAPPRLAAHLRAVHQAAELLVGALAERCPKLLFSADAVLFGAATHDIGKSLHVPALRVCLRLLCAQFCEQGSLGVGLR